MMGNWKKLRNSGPWKFTLQGDKFGYSNNPRWTEEADSEDMHHPCGYWPKDIHYIPPDVLPIWEPSSMSFDPETRKLYTTCVRNYTGTKYFRKVFETDIDTFKHTRCWGAAIPGDHDDGTLTGPRTYIPYFRDELVLGHVWWNTDHGDRYLIPVSSYWNDGMLVDLLDAKNNTITHYDLTPSTGNTTYNDDDLVGEPSIRLTTANYEQMRLYVVLFDTYYYTRDLVIGYLDLTETAPPYTWTRILYEYNTLLEKELTLAYKGDSPFRVYPEQGRIILSGLYDKDNSWFAGFVKIWNMSGEVKGEFRSIEDSSYPRLGMGNVVLHPNGYIYGRCYPTSEELDSSEDRRGLARLDPSSGEMTYFLPDYDQESNRHAFRTLHVGSNGYIYVNHFGYGIGEFNPNTASWRLLDDWTLPGLHPAITHLHDGRFTYGLYYDEQTRSVYSGYGLTLWSTGPWENGHTDLHWFPERPGHWGCFIARHSIDIWSQYLAEQPNQKGLGLPLIWTMPKLGG